jgi:hypothetical protein
MVCEYRGGSCKRGVVACGVDVEVAGGMNEGDTRTGDAGRIICEGYSLFSPAEREVEFELK